MRSWMILATVPFVMAASVGDNDLDPLSELAALGDALADTGPEVGGSIRAKKDAQLAELQRLKAPENVEGRVEEVRRGRFPAVALRIRVLRPAQSGPGKELRRNAIVVVVPALAVTAGKVRLDDPATQVNAGAFYLRRGDRVVFEPAKRSGKFWQASFIGRR